MTWILASSSTISALARERITTPSSLCSAVSLQQGHFSATRQNRLSPSRFRDSRPASVLAFSPSRQVSIPSPFRRYASASVCIISVLLTASPVSSASFWRAVSHTVASHAF
jgi:hypothetical protein